MRFLWIAVLLAVLGLLAAETSLRIRNVQELTAMDGGYAPQLPSADSASGYAMGMRRVVPSDRNDDLHWVVNSQLASEQGLLRLRSVDYDNAPMGREVHWSSVYSWWLRLLAFGDVRSIEWTSLWANLALSIVTMSGLAYLLNRLEGQGAAIVFCLGFSALIPFRDVFKFGMGDHHAAAILAGFGCVLFLTLAVRKSLHGERRSGLLMCSSAAGGLAMWVNVVSVLPVFSGIGLSFLCIRFVRYREFKEEERALYAGLIRRWARFGALFALVAYLVEYAPAVSAFRLEVNHPLYCLAWLGAGEVLALLFDLEKWSPARLAKLGVCAALVLQLPLVVYFARESVFQVADPFLLAVHNRYIMEFQSLWANLSVMNSPLRVFAMLSPFLILGAGVVVALRSREDRALFASLALTLAPVCILFLATLYQARWWSQLAAVLILVLVALYMDTSRSKVARLCRGLALASLLPGFLIFVYGSFSSGAPAPRALTRVVEKSVAHYLRARVGNSDLVVLASPDTTTNMIYFAGAEGVGTFYWENREGLKRAARIFASPSTELAKERIVEAGVSHVVIFSWGGFEKEYLNLYRDFLDETVEGRPFLMRLMEDKEIPPWLRPIPFQLADKKSGMAFIFEVVPEMSPGQLASRRFEYLLEMGFGQAAHSLETLLREHSGEIAARVSLCRLLALQNRGREFASELDRLVAATSKVDASLALGDEIRLSGILLVGSKAEEARRHLTRALSRLDEASARSLNAETIRHLWDLVDVLKIDYYDPRLRTFSQELLPSRLR